MKTPFDEFGLCEWSELEYLLSLLKYANLPPLELDELHSELTERVESERYEELKDYLWCNQLNPVTETGHYSLTELSKFLKDTI